MKPGAAAAGAMALLAGITSGARSQVCQGYPSLRETRYRAAASVATYTYARALGLSFTAGRSLYATLEVGRTHDAELDATTWPIRLEGGADVGIGGGRVFLCPLAAFAVSLGPYDYVLSQENFRYLDGSAGLGLAAVPVRSGRLVVAVTGSIRAARVWASYSPTGDAAATGSRGWSASDGYWLASLGVGFTIGGLVTVRPAVSVPFGIVPPDSPTAFAAPFGREEREVSYGVAVAVGFGRRTAAR